MPRVSDLTEALTIADGDFIYAVVGGNSRKVRKDTLVPASSSIKPQTAVSASGQTAIPLSGIPSWANRVTVNVAGLSTSGTSNVVLQIGPSGGVETTNYLGTATVIGSGGVGTALQLSTGFVFSNGTLAAATNVRHGKVVFDRQTGNTWVCDGRLALSEALLLAATTGSKALAGTLAQVLVTTVGGTETFDAGSVALSWE